MALFIAWGHFDANVLMWIFDYEHVSMLSRYTYSHPEQELYTYISSEHSHWLTV
jgi:hypothetical protein